MAEPTLQDVMTALQNADKAGDVEAAKRLAAIADKMRVAPSSEGGIPNEGFLGQANRGIADFVDFVNPFDDPAWQNVAGGRFYTGSSRDMMRNVGIAVAEEEPETIVQAAGRGLGEASAALLPIAKGLQALSKAQGVSQAVRQFADDAYRALLTPGGAAIEAGAGAVGAAAGEVAEEAGAPEWVQTTAELAAPAVAVPAAIAATRGTARAAGNIGAAAATGIPFAGPVIRRGANALRSTVREALPMTEGGAREVARDELRRSLGGEERAAELGQRIVDRPDLNITPAQQVEDPALLALERAAAEENPLLRERLIQRAGAARVQAEADIRGDDGDPSDARAFFNSRVQQAADAMRARTERVMASADEGMEAAYSRAQPEGVASSRMVGELKGELDDALQQERQLWAAVPITARVDTQNTRRLVQQLLDDTPWAQRRDVPADLREAFGDNGILGDQTTVRELHGLYSEMRRVARSAMAGNDQNKNRARIANAVADSILEDLGATDNATAVGRAINDARQFSRELHETFDQGAVGRVLKRTLDGDEMMTTEAALRRTVGRGGVEGAVASEEIERAAANASTPITDYLRRDFADAAVDPTEKFTPAKARRWLRDNRETLQRYPALMNELRRALTNREAAEAFAVRAKARIDLMQGGAVARFAGGPIEKAVPAILGADSPAVAARAIRATAAKDPSGAALAGIKGAFSDYLIQGALTREGGMSGERLIAVLNDRKMAAALREVFSTQEIANMRRVADALRKIDAAEASPSAGAVINRPANRVIDMVARVGAARAGGEFAQGSMGGSLQTANIFAGRAREFLGRMTNARARELLMDAIEDPELMRALLTEPGRIQNLRPEVRSKLAPYFIGGLAVAGEE